MYFAPLRRDVIVRFSMGHVNLGEWALAQGRDDALAFEDYVECCSYEQARREVAEIAVGLLSAGVRIGDSVAVYMPNSVRAMLCILGIWRVGAVVVSLPYRYTEKDISVALETWAADWVITSQTHADAFSGLDEGPEVVIVDNVKGAGGRCPSLVVGNDAHALVRFTSGTTEMPKVVVHSAGALSALKSGNSPCRAITNIAIGSMISTLQTLLSGGTQIFLDTSVKGDQLVCALSDFAPERARLDTESVLSLIETGSQICSSLRHVVLGGDLVAANTQKYIKSALGVDVTQVYGSTEAFAMTRGNVDTPLGSVGQALPDVELQLRSDMGGAEIEGAGQGLAYIRSPRMFLGYGSRGSIHSKVDDDGWFNTGDILRRDDNDNYFFINRVERYLKVNGIRISPEEVENAFRDIPGVKNVVAVTTKTSRGNDCIAVVLELAEVEQGLGVQLQVTLLEKLPEIKRPSSFFIIHQLPFSGAGKIDLAQIVNRIENNKLQQVTLPVNDIDVQI
ncbi:class I adenylate-forming enzyme family protein [Pseudovibrio denitrificans]|uniref:class I adenylate-forming enzyme family protein n=1 Tax=Pseudovibrio denitrificans TaxID=258256 RepID=UPI0039BEEF6D